MFGPFGWYKRQVMNHCNVSNTRTQQLQRAIILHHCLRCSFQLDFIWYKVATYFESGSYQTAVLTSCCHPVIPHRNTNVSDNQRTPVCSFHFPVSVKLLAPHQLLLWRDGHGAGVNKTMHMLVVFFHSKKLFLFSKKIQLGFSKTSFRQQTLL